MRILKQKLDSFQVSYPLEKIAPLENLLFLDIETTGFTAKTSNLYMIGCAYYSDNHWHIIQWFANASGEEKELLTAFFTFSASYSHLIHFNGNNFDIPYMTQKCGQYGLSYSFHSFIGIDLYRRISPYKEFLNLPNCKQKTIEHFLGINRQDRYNGGELISVYQEYLLNPSELALQILLLHNSEDMKGMLKIIPILAFSDLLSREPKVKKAQANYYSDFNGVKQQELLLGFKLPAPLPIPFHRHKNGCHLSVKDLNGTLKIPIYEEEMKYFYSNYQDYYYLPEEDIALHKSVASYVDKNFREKAHASNCYTKKFSSYLPQWEVLFEPFFKRSYESKEFFFELTEEMKSQRTVFNKYASHILQMMN